MWVLHSALQKAIRWCEIIDARYFAKELIEMGKPGSHLNSLIGIAAEDIGLGESGGRIEVRTCYYIPIIFHRPL